MPAQTHTVQRRERLLLGQVPRKGGEEALPLRRSRQLPVGPPDAKNTSRVMSSSISKKECSDVART